MRPLDAEHVTELVEERVLVGALRVAARGPAGKKRVDEHRRRKCIPPPVNPCRRDALHFQSRGEDASARGARSRRRGMHVPSEGGLLPSAGGAPPGASETLPACSGDTSPSMGSASRHLGDTSRRLETDGCVVKRPERAIYAPLPTNSPKAYPLWSVVFTAPARLSSKLVGSKV